MKTLLVIAAVRMLLLHCCSTLAPTSIDSLHITCHCRLHTRLLLVSLAA